jgi:hypothetical protein
MKTKKRGKRPIDKATNKKSNNSPKEKSNVTDKKALKLFKKLAKKNDYDGAWKPGKRGRPPAFWSDKKGSKKVKSDKKSKKNKKGKKTKGNKAEKSSGKHSLKNARKAFRAAKKTFKQAKMTLRKTKKIFFKMKKAA